MNDDTVMLEQKGAIVWSDGMDRAEWTLRTQIDGYVVVDQGDFAYLCRHPK